MNEPAESGPGWTHHGTDDETASTGLTCVVECSAPIGVLRLVGSLTVESASMVRSALHKALTEQPSAIVVDLSGTTADDPIALTVFTAFAHTAAGSPGCPVLLCAPAQRLAEDLERMGVNRAVPVYPYRSSALAAAAAVPPARRVVRPLPPSRVACAVARKLTDTCREWQVPGPTQTHHSRSRHVQRRPRHDPRRHDRRRLGERAYRDREDRVGDAPPPPR